MAIVEEALRTRASSLPLPLSSVNRHRIVHLPDGRVMAGDVSERCYDSLSLSLFLSLSLSSSLPPSLPPCLPPSLSRSL